MSVKVKHRVISSISDLMELAIEKTREGIAKGQTPFGAAIAKKMEDGGYQVVAVEHNDVWATKDITEHAEVHAIRVACRILDSIKLTGCIIASTTEPCPMCFSAIHWAGIDEIYYGTNIADAQKAGFSELTISDSQMKDIGHSPVKIHPNFMADDARKLFAEWAKKPHKTY